MRPAVDRRVPYQLDCYRLRPGGAYGTIGLVTDRRIRLSTEDIALIVASLRSRAAMTRGVRRHRTERLATRLAEGQRGNPKWILDEMGQTHEEDLGDGDELDA